MSSPRPARRVLLRWLVPLGIAVVVAALVHGTFRPAAPTRTLPTTTTADLIAAVQTPPVTGFSGTVVSRTSLGLPQFPALADGAGFGSLLTGSHTLRVWYAGPERQRIALLGATDETDIFRRDRTVWVWNSANQHATRSRLPDEYTRLDLSVRPVVPADATTLTPDQVARSLLADLDPSTQVLLGEPEQIADRSSYELILRPRTASTRIKAVHIAIDGETKIPLSVEIFARNGGSPEIEIAFTSIRLQAPGESYFDFSPPPGARVSKAVLPEDPFRRYPDDGRNPTHVIGTGWTRILDYPPTYSMNQWLRSIQHLLVPRSGTWGRGRLLETPLGCVLLAGDGHHIYAGAVNPDALYAAAAAR